MADDAPIQPAVVSYGKAPSSTQQPAERGDQKEDMVDVSKVPLGTPVILRRSQFLDMTERCEQAMDLLISAIEVVEKEPLVPQNRRSNQVLDKLLEALHTLDEMHDQQIATWDDLIANPVVQLQDKTEA